MHEQYAIKLAKKFNSMLEKGLTTLLNPRSDAYRKVFEAIRPSWIAFTSREIKVENLRQQLVLATLNPLIQGLKEIGDVPEDVEAVFSLIAEVNLVYEEIAALNRKFASVLLLNVPRLDECIKKLVDIKRFFDANKYLFQIG